MVKVIPLKNTPQAVFEAFLKLLTDEKVNITSAALVWVESTEDSTARCITPLVNNPSLDQLRLLLHDISHFLDHLKYDGNYDEIDITSS